MCGAEDFQAEVEQFLDDVLSGVESDKYDDIEVRFVVPCSPIHKASMCVICISRWHMLLISSAEHERRKQHASIW